MKPTLRYTERVIILMTKEQREIIERAAKKRGISVAEQARRMMFEKSEDDLAQRLERLEVEVQRLSEKP